MPVYGCSAHAAKPDNFWQSNEPVSLNWILHPVLSSKSCFSQSIYSLIRCFSHHCCLHGLFMSQQFAVITPASVISVVVVVESPFVIKEYLNLSPYNPALIERSDEK